MKFHLYSWNVSTNVKIAMQCFENFGGGKCPKCPHGCAPDSNAQTILASNSLMQ